METHTEDMLVEALAMVGVLALLNTHQVSTELADRVVDAISGAWGPGVVCDAKPEEMAEALIARLTRA